MQIAVVLVHYHTPHLLQRAIDALQKDAQRAGLRLDGVVVDNGSRSEDRELLASLPFRVLTAPENLGYAGGANLGLKSTTADLAIVMNPDVEVLPGCLDALCNVLRGGTAVAGPRFYWDAAKQFQLPPTETVSRRDELLRLLAERDGFWRHRARQRWRRHSRRFFDATEPLPSFDLSGALMAFQRRAWLDVGPFDEEYALYFEETDWLQRLRRRGESSVFVPAAEAVHLYAQSTVREGRAQQWFEDSQRRFRRQVYGARWTRLLESMARRWAPSGAHAEAPVPPPSSTDAPRWLEVSSGPKGFPAAVRRLPETVEDPFEIPEDIRRRMAPGRYGLRLVDGRGREGAFRWLEMDGVD